MFVAQLDKLQSVQLRLQGVLDKLSIVEVSATARHAHMKYDVVLAQQRDQHVLLLLQARTFKIQAHLSNSAK